MPLIAYNLTLTDLGIDRLQQLNGGLIAELQPALIVPPPAFPVRIPASTANSARGPATDVTLVVGGWQREEYIALENARAGRIEFAWTGAAEFATGSLAAFVDPQYRSAVFVDSETGDDDNPGSAPLPVRTIDQAFKLVNDNWRGMFLVKLAPSGTPYEWNHPLIYLGKPNGAFAAPLLLQGGFTSEFGVTAAAPGSTATDIATRRLNQAIRNGRNASVVAAANGTMRVSGLNAFAFGDAGRLLLLRGASAAGNNGTFTIQAWVDANTVDVVNTQGVANDVNNGNIEWRESFEGSTLRFLTGVLAGQRRSIRDQSAGGPLTTFQVNTPFSQAPAAGDEFAIEKPAATINYGSDAQQGVPYVFDSGTLGIQGVRFRNVTSKQLTFRLAQLQLEGVEFALNGGNLSLSNYSIMPSGQGSAPAQWGNVPLFDNPFESARIGSGAFVHDGTFLITSHCRASGYFIMRNMTVNVMEGDFSPTSLDGKRTTINLNGSRFNHIGDRAQKGRLNGQATQSPTKGIVNFGSGSRSDQLVELDISNSAGYAIDCQNGSTGIVLGNVTGAGNAKAGIRVDRRSGVTINDVRVVGGEDVGGPTTVTGAAGDVEFGRERPVPNVRSYAAVNQPDATQVRGFQDGRGNRVDA